MTAYGIGGLIRVPAAPIKGIGAPSELFKGQLGQFYFDISVSPRDIYIFDGSTWQLGGNSLASTTLPGIVEIDEDLTAVPSVEFVVPSALAAKTYSDGVVVSPPVTPWSETVSGIGELATTVEAIAVTSDDVIITPLKAAAIFDSPPNLGLLVPDEASFITLQVSGPCSIIGELIVETDGHPLLLGNDNSNDPINIGTGLGERSIRICDGIGNSSVDIETGTGDLDVGANAISHIVNIGNTTGSSTLNIDAGSGEVNAAGNVNLTASATKIKMNGGAVTDFIGIGTLVDGTLTINNTNIAANDRIILSRAARNGAALMGHFIYTINPGVSFTVDSYNDSGVAQTTDKSIFTYEIVRQT